MIGARSRLAAPLAAAVLITACGSGGSHPVHHQNAPRKLLTSPATTVPPNAPVPIPDPAPTGISATPSAVRVIRGWSDALRRGDLRGAARFFAMPSVMINGEGEGDETVIRIGSFTAAEAANATLPCGAKLLSTDMRGRYVNALFVLTGRPGPGGTDCGSGAGTTARTNFVIANGRIVRWIRAPDDPGDNGSGSAV